MNKKPKDIWNYLDEIGEKLIGHLWRDLYETIQDTFALCLIFSAPSLIGKLILGKEYSGFDQCYNEWNIWNVNRYSCYVIVGSGFLLWIIITGRILGRTIKNISCNKKHKK